MCEHVTVRLDNLSQNNLTEIKKKYDVTVVGNSTFVRVTGEEKEKIERLVAMCKGKQTFLAKWRYSIMRMFRRQEA